VTRRAFAGWLVVAAVIGAAVAVIALGPITRGPEFHRYADGRTWLGIPHAGDVLSNLAFLLVAAWAMPAARARGVPGAVAACGGVAAIGLGSGIYHWAPSDPTLVLDWASIAVTLMLVVVAVGRDRIGPRAGHALLAFAPLGAALAVGWWVWTGGTSGGDLAPYVAIQALGVGLPPLIALAAPGRIGAGWLVAAVGGFALARVLARHDAALLDAIGVSGHSLKHVAAAAAAGLALRGLIPARADR